MGLHLHPKDPENMKLVTAPLGQLVHSLQREIESYTSLSLEKKVPPMATFDPLMNRNKDFSAHQFVISSSLKPTLEETLGSAKALIIACADPRDDPAYVLGFEPGEAVVLRNIGGRITPGTLQMMALLNRIGQVAGENPGGGKEFHLIVLHHTDCGIKRLADNPDLLATYFGIDKEGLTAKAVTDPRAAVAVDVATLKAIPALPGEWLVSGLVLDVATGLVETVVPPSPLATSSAK